MEKKECSGITCWERSHRVGGCFTYIYRYFSKKISPILHLLLQFHFVSYCVIFLILLNFFFFFIPFWSHFFTFCDRSELSIIWKIVVASFIFVIICYFLLLSILYIFVIFYNLFFEPFWYKMFIHFTFKKRSLQLSITALIFFHTYIYVYM
jgi:hypothetical protein